MTRRKTFLRAVMSTVYLNGAMGVVAVVGGCDDSTQSAPVNPEFEAKEKQSQKRMLEYLAKKKPGGGTKKK